MGIPHGGLHQASHIGFLGSGSTVNIFFCDKQRKAEAVSQLGSHFLGEIFMSHLKLGLYFHGKGVSTMDAHQKSPRKVAKNHQNH